MDFQQFEERKRDHIKHALHDASQTLGLSGLESIHLFHDALPELDWEDIRVDSPCLGLPLSTPFYVAGMTAGHADAAQLNRLLARACQERGWAMGVGSQRRELADESGHRLDEWKRLRDEAPEAVLFANLGASQILTAPTAAVLRIVSNIQASGLCVHLNVLQELMQPEGTPQFKGVMARVRELCAELEVPVIFKETGSGMSPATLRKIRQLPVRAVDVSGVGGTHWGRIEGLRAADLDRRHRLALAADTFRNWGEPTADSVLAAREILPDTMEIWASGGVRSGLDAAKLIALGAHRVGFAKPALEAALQGYEALVRWMDLQEFELKTALFCTGTGTPAELRRKEGVWKKNED